MKIESGGILKSAVLNDKEQQMASCETQEGIDTLEKYGFFKRQDVLDTYWRYKLKIK